MTHNSGAEREAELMFDILDFARRHGRKILNAHMTDFGGETAKPAFQKLLIGEYLRKVEKKDFQAFYTLTSKGLNLFEEKRRSQLISEELKTRIIEKLQKAMAELEVKPWEVMFHIIYVIGKNRTVTTQDILEYFKNYFHDIKGTSRSNVYRSIKHLRMKEYIGYEKKTHLQSQYRLSEKGEEIFYMAKAQAARKLRTSEEWDQALKKVFDSMADQQKEDEEALFYALENALPGNLDNPQVVWVLYTQGTVFELKGNLDKAEEVYIRMDEICEELEDTRGRAYALKGLGNVSFKKKKYTVAEQYYRRCHKIAHNVQDALLLSDVLNNLGSCFYMKDDIDEALHMFEKALTLAGDNTGRVASRLYNKGLCYARKEDLDKARKFWSESLILYRKLQEKTEIIWVEYNLREIDRMQKGEHLEKTYRRALLTGASKDIKRAYKELSEFKIDGLIKSTES